jgi:hypothetical protein
MTVKEIHIPHQRCFTSLFPKSAYLLVNHSSARSPLSKALTGQKKKFALVGIPQGSPETEPFMTVVSLFRLYAAGIDQGVQFRRFP